MSLYSLATDLFADMDKVRAETTATDRARKYHQQRGTSESGRREQVDAISKEDLLPRLRPGGSDPPPTLELLEGCLKDVQKSRLSARRRRETFEPAPGQSDVSLSPSSGMKSFAAEGQPNCSPRDRHASRKRSSSFDAMGGPDTDGDDTLTSTAAVIVQQNSTTVNRVPHQLDVWRTLPASISRTSSLSSDIEEPMEEVGVTVERDVSTGTCNPKTETTDGVLQPDKFGETSVRLLPRDTGSAMDRVAERRKGSNTDTDTDAAATASFVDFEGEVQDWRLSGVQEKASLRDRTNFAAHLSEKYLCNTLDPMPSSPIVCRLRREIARRIDSLAQGVEKGAPPDVASRGGREREKRGIRELGTEHVPTAPQFEQGDIDSNGRPARLFNKGNGRTSLAAGGKHRAHPESLASSRAGRSSTQRSSSVRLGSDFGNMARTRRVKTPEEVSSTTLQDELGSQISDTNTTTTIASSSSSSSEPARGLDEMRRALEKLGERNSSREAARGGSERGRFAVEFPSMAVRGDDQKRGSSDRSCRPDEGEPRARAVRFLLEDEAEETHSNGVEFGEAVDGVPQKAQENGERDGLTAAVKHEENAETKTMEDGGCWTCVVCRTPNDELGGTEGCTTCGRRRQRPQRCGGGPRLETVPAVNPITRNSRQLDFTTDRRYEKERAGLSQSVKKTFTDNNSARANKGPSREKNADTSATRETAGQSEHRGPYDIASFARMRQTTQPIVNARLGLTREIQSLLSSIRR